MITDNKIVALIAASFAIIAINIVVPTDAFAADINCDPSVVVKFNSGRPEKDYIIVSELPRYNSCSFVKGVGYIPSASQPPLITIHFSYGYLRLKRGDRFAHFQSNTGIIFPPNRTIVLPAGTHTITYTDTVDNENRIFTITVNANGREIDALSSITTVPNNVAPTANAGPDQAVTSGTQVTLDGTGSTDSDGTVASYAWTRTGGTGTAANAILSSATASKPTFTDSSLTSNDTAVTHIFSLVVTDDDGATSVADTVTITINPPADSTSSPPADSTSSPPADSTSSPPADSTSPNVVISTSINKHDGSTAFVATVTFDEPVKGFVDGELVATNATIGPLSSNTGTGTVFTATITPRSPLDVVLSVAAGVAQDMADNNNIAADKVTVKGTIIEYTQRVISSFMQTRAHHILNNQPDLKGFITGDNLGGPGRLGNLALNANRAQFDLAFATSRSKIIAAQQADTRINQAFGAVSSSQTALQDKNRSAFGETTTDTDSYRLGYASVENAVSPVEAPGAVDQSSTSRTGTWDIWTEFYGSRAKMGTAGSSLWLGYVGAHYFTAENQLIGILGQLDWTEEKGAIAISRTEGLGWMVGPYAAGKVTGHNLFYEARLAYGQSDNKVSPIGTYSDDFTTQRWLAHASLSGQYKYDDYTITPQASIAWYRDTQQRYTDSLGNTISQQTVELGELRFGPSLSRVFELENGLLIEPEIGMSGVWSFGVSNNALQGTQGVQASSLPANNMLRARLDMGLELTFPGNGMSLSLKGHYDGIGINNYQSYGGNLRLKIPFN